MFHTFLSDKYERNETENTQQWNEVCVVHLQIHTYEISLCSSYDDDDLFVEVKVKGMKC